MAEMLIRPETDFSAERAGVDESLEAWNDGLQADQQSWHNLLETNGLTVEPLQTYATEEEIAADFADGLRQSFGLQSRSDAKERIQTTLQEAEWAGVPAHYAGDSEAGATYQAAYLESQPDYSLHSWVLNSLQPDSADSYSADTAARLFADPTDWQRWETAFNRHTPALRSLAEKLGLGDLSESELTLLALSLRLGIVGTNPYLKESSDN